MSRQSRSQSFFERLVSTTQAIPLLSTFLTEWSPQVCQVANALIELGVRKGDTVTIYMPMVPETVYAMLACARIGAIHS